MARWEQDFDVYMALIEEAPASFVLDLAAAEHAPVASHPVRLHVRFAMQRPREDGLRDGSELEALGALEDEVVSRLEKALDALYVGRLVHGGYTELFLYLPEAQREAAIRAGELLEGLDPYEPEWLVEDDAEWSLYREFLLPDMHSMQRIQNRRLLHELQSAGDALEIPREVDHVAYFPSRAQADAARQQLAMRGFRVDEVAPRDDGDENRFGVEFHRKDALAKGRPDEFCDEILATILPLEGDYGGWGTPVVKP